MKKRHFSYRVWRWTGCNENLFDLPKDALDNFILFTKEASK